VKTPEPGKYQGNLSEKEMHHVKTDQTGLALCSVCQPPKCFNCWGPWSSASGKPLTYGEQEACLYRRCQGRKV